MRKKFKVLQIGTQNDTAAFESNNNIYWQFVHIERLIEPYEIIEGLKVFLKKAKAFDFILIEAHKTDELMMVIEDIVTPYNTYVTSTYWPEFESLKLTRQMLIREFSAPNRKALIEKIKSIAYVGQYGDKIHTKSIVAHPSFKGQVEYLGNKYVVFDCPETNEFVPIATWRYNIFYEKDRVLEVWPEFEIDNELDMQLRIRMIPSGTIGMLTEEYVVALEDLQEPIKFKRLDYEAYLSITVEVKGKGKLLLGALHRRWSRLEFGSFLMGGKRFADDQRNEFIYYLHPGDLKPPLNVYFSGYRTAEGFEGYFMMNMFDAPFLLIADPRLEGGSFYMGSQEYEHAIKEVIEQSLEQLGFNSDDLILSGLSMGSFGALYYGAQLNPAAVIAGKPLVNVGTIADNMKLLRPNDFGTANDVLMSLTGGTSKEHIAALNEKFWKVFSDSDLSQTTFALSYMMHDDYDLLAFDDLLHVLSEKHVKTISRAIPGRHNDDSSTINNWFVHFYNVLLETEFGRIPHDR